MFSSGSGRYGVRRRRNRGLAFVLEGRSQKHCVNDPSDHLKPEQMEGVLYSCSFTFHGSFLGRMISRWGPFSSMGILVQAVITKYHRLRGLGRQKFIIHTSGSSKSKIKVPGSWVSGENFVPGLQMVTSHCVVLTWPGERKKALGVSSSYTNPIRLGAHPSNLISP